MCNPFASCETVETVLARVASEIGSAADDLSTLEQSVADLVVAAGQPSSLEQLQALDRLGQQLRTLELFLRATSPCSCGRVDIDGALDKVWLEAVRKRLGGGKAAAHVAADPDFW